MKAAPMFVMLDTVDETVFLWQELARSFIELSKLGQSTFVKELMNALLQSPTARTLTILQMEEQSRLPTANSANLPLPANGSSNVG